MAEPLKRAEIFDAPPPGYAGVRVPTLSVMKSGDILCKLTAAKTAKGDWSPADVLTVRSSDGGKTWSKPEVLFSNDTSTVNALTIVGRDGTLHLLIMRDYGSIEYASSTDDGKTFSKPVPITDVLNEWKKTSGYEWTVVSPGPGSGIELQNGRLLAPLWMSNSPDRKHRPTCVTTIYSDDQGKTWHVGDIVADTTPETPTPNESDAIQLPDGRVIISMRNGSPLRQRLVAESPDGSTRWSKPRYVPELFEPVCEASWTVVPLPGGKHMIVHVAPAPTGENMPEPPKQAPRENLTIYASLDDGKTWPIRKSLDKGRSSYSDVTVGKDGRIYVAYESGADPDPKRRNGTTGITFLSIDPAWVLEGNH